MWTVTTTAVNSRQETVSHTIRIYSNSWEALFDGRYFRWEVFDSLMEKGNLRKVVVDFVPTGPKRIKKIDGLFYLFIGDVRVSNGYAEREDAWNSDKVAI